MVHRVVSTWETAKARQARRRQRDAGATAPTAAGDRLRPRGRVHRRGTLTSLTAADDATGVSDLPRAVPQSDAQYLDPRIPAAPAVPQNDAQYLDPRIPTQP